MSVGLGLRAIGRDRMLFRSETVTRVRWSRANGVWVDLKGQRMALPSGGGADVQAEVDMEDAAPIPYFPGRDALWIGSDNGLTRAEVNDRELVHPLALGSEAYYTYSTGDSLTLTLSDSRVIRLRELRIEPRRPEWKLSVGSFWFDVETGQLVRAAYRLAVPIDIWTVAKEEAKREGERDPDDEVPFWVKPLISPMKASLEAVTIEYGLFGGRFWLPRTQFAQAFAQVSFMRVPVRIEESFRYLDVNGVDTLPPVPTRPKSLVDSLFPNDSTPWRELSREERERRDSIISVAARERVKARRAKREDECRTSGTYTQIDSRSEGTLTVATRVPCDSSALIKAPEFANTSIYDEGEEVFGIRERDELVRSLGFGLQSAWAPQAPVFRYGLEMTRYNRVEGLATGLGVRQDFGLGYTADAQVRYGLADKKVTGELSVERSNGRNIWRLGGYHRLVAANDWGSPLTFGSSFSAVLFGVDDGAYYRAGGAELVLESARGGGSSLRFFGERHRGAKRETHWSLANAINDVKFQENIVTTPGDIAGLAAHLTNSYGLDPMSWRSQFDLRLEGAVGDFQYERVAADVAVSRPIGRSIAASISAGAGAGFGDLPLQRRFYLGGAHTVRGQQLDLTGGESYWLARAELGLANVFARPVLFGDLGWAGPRDDWSKPGRPMSGVGAGLSLVDGLIRFDLARGIYPTDRWRFYGYIEAKF
jgi:hypothetical protein